MDICSVARARWQITRKHFRIDKLALPLSLSLSLSFFFSLSFWFPLRINVDDRATHDLSQNQRGTRPESGDPIQRQAYNRGGIAIDRRHHAVTVVHTTRGVVNAETATATSTGDDRSGGYVDVGLYLGRWAATTLLAQLATRSDPRTRLPVLSILLPPPGDGTRLFLVRSLAMLAGFGPSEIGCIADCTHYGGYTARREEREDVVRGRS